MMSTYIFVLLMLCALSAPTSTSMRASEQSDDLKSTCSAPKAISCDRTAQVEDQLRASLEKYAGGKESGAFLSTNVHVTCDSVKGRGLRFEGKQLNKSEIFLRLPLTALYTAQSLMNERVKAINHLDALAISLIEQIVLHNGYALSMPIEDGVMTGFRMCDEDIEAKIKDEGLREQARGMREMVEERGEELKQIGFISDPSYYAKILSIVQSRVFVIRAKRSGEWVKIPALAMVVDMMNLAPSGKSNTDCQTNEDSTHFECFATKQIVKGEELLAPFEKHTTEDLDSYTWFHYGFQFTPEEL